MTEHLATSHLLLLVARYAWRQRNAAAATLAWIAENAGWLFESYYDMGRLGIHYGGGNPRKATLEAMAGGLVSGGRHLESIAMATQRFRSTVIACGPVFASGLLAEIQGARSNTAVIWAQEGDLVGLYEAVFSAFEKPWPSHAVMLASMSDTRLAGIDAYCYPEVFFRQAIGVEETLGDEQLFALSAKGVRDILTVGVQPARCDQLKHLGFAVHDSELIAEGDDYASVSRHLVERWGERRGGWLVGDPVLASYWLPTACREKRLAIFSIPQVRVVSDLREKLAESAESDAPTSVIGRQYDDRDFFLLSELGHSFQLIDPGRPPIPAAHSVPAPWPIASGDPREADPSDEELVRWARDGRVVISLVFWTGAAREGENLYALTDLVSRTGVRAGVALTVQSLGWRPAPLDLLIAPREQGGTFPNLEVLLASCGDGVAIESLLPAGQLDRHLHSARTEMDRLGVPAALRPDGWWGLMDAPLEPLSRNRRPKPFRILGLPPFVKIRYWQAVDADEDPGEGGGGPPRSNAQRSSSVARTREMARDFYRRMRIAVRDSRARALFDAYRPYEAYEPGPLSPSVAATVQRQGFSYMLSKSGFGTEPRVLLQDGSFVALNYTAGRWDGWTPFETINDVSDLRVAERHLRRSKRPAWLLGGIDTCLWAFSGELWRRAPGLESIANFVANGGSSGELINVTPRVIARYARILAESGRVPRVAGSHPVDRRSKPLRAFD